MGTDQTDIELVQACAKGDERAWRTLIDRYAPLVISIARRCGFSVEDCNDVLQTVSMILLREVARLRDGQSLAKWVITTTKRECWRKARRDRRRRDFAAQVRPDALLVRPELEDERLEREQAVRLALSRLSGRCRDLLQALVAAPGVADYQTVADRLRMPVGSIGPTRGRCLERLREELMTGGAWPLFEALAGKENLSPGVSRDDPRDS